MKTLEELLITPRMFYAPLDNNNSVEGLMEMLIDIDTKEFNIVEIGSFSGVSSDMIARFCNKLICIDVWSLGSPGISKEQLSIARKRFTKVMNDHNNIISVEDYSENVAELIDDESMDMVYIDAVHDYAYVLRDIETWSRKIRSGGFITGHDIHMTGVKEAVEKSFGDDYKTYKDGSWSYQKR